MIGVNLERVFTRSFVDSLMSEFCCVTKRQLDFEISDITFSICEVMCSKKSSRSKLNFIRVITSYEKLL